MFVIIKMFGLSGKNKEKTAHLKELEELRTLNFDFNKQLNEKDSSIQEQIRHQLKRKEEEFGTDLEKLIYDYEHKIQTDEASYIEAMNAFEVEKQKANDLETHLKEQEKIFGDDIKKLVQDSEKKTKALHDEYNEVVKNLQVATTDLEDKMLHDLVAGNSKTVEVEKHAANTRVKLEDYNQLKQHEEDLKLRTNELETKLDSAQAQSKQQEEDLTVEKKKTSDLENQLKERESNFVDATKELIADFEKKTQAIRDEHIVMIDELKKAIVNLENNLIDNKKRLETEKHDSVEAEKLRTNEFEAKLVTTEYQLKQEQEDFKLRVKELEAKLDAVKDHSKQYEEDLTVEKKKSSDLEIHLKEKESHSVNAKNELIVNFDKKSQDIRDEYSVMIDELKKANANLENNLVDKEKELETAKHDFVNQQKILIDDLVAKSLIDIETEKLKANELKVKLDAAEDNLKQYEEDLTIEKRKTNGLENHLKELESHSATDELTSYFEKKTQNIQD